MKFRYILIKNLFHDTQTVLVIFGVALVLIILVLYPMLTVVLRPELEDWKELLETTAYIKVITNTMFIVLLSSVTATSIGFLFAYAVERAKIPFRKFISYIAILPIFAPPFVFGLSIIYLFGRNGLITRHILGIEYNIYGWQGLWIAQTLCNFPIAFLTISSILRGSNPTIEHMAMSLGANRFTIFRTITLPMAMPGIGSALLLTMMLALGDFGNPMVIGGRFRVLAVEAFAQVLGRHDMGMGSAIATVLLIPSFLLFTLYYYFEKRKRYITVIGKGSRMEMILPKPLLRRVLLVLCILLVIFIGMIYLTIGLGAFTKIWGYDWSLTFSHISEMFFIKRGMGRIPLWNSTKASLAAGLIVAIYATFGAYIINRKVRLGKGFFNFLAILPMGVPGTFMGLGFILAFNTPPIVLTGTLSIIILSMMIRSLPLGYRAAQGTLKQIDVSIEECASDLGANPIRVFRDIVFPLLRTPFIFSFIYSFMLSINTLSAIIFLVSPRSNLASVFTMAFVERGDWSKAAALTLGIMIITYSVLAVFQLIMKGEKGGGFQI